MWFACSAAIPFILQPAGKIIAVKPYIVSSRKTFRSTCGNHLRQIITRQQAHIGSIYRHRKSAGYDQYYLECGPNKASWYIACSVGQIFWIPTNIFGPSQVVPWVINAADNKEAYRHTSRPTDALMYAQTHARTHIHVHTRRFISAIKWHESTTLAWPPEFRTVVQ